MATTHKEMYTLVDEKAEMPVESAVVDGKMVLKLGDFRVSQHDIVNLCGSLLRTIILHASEMPEFRSIPPSRAVHPMAAVDEMQNRMEQLKSEIVRNALSTVINKDFVPEAVLAVHFDVCAEQPKLISSNGNPMGMKITHVVPSFVAFPATPEEGVRAIR